MKDHEPQIKLQHLVVFVMSFGVPPFLYLIRHLDNNRLTSWKWAFNAGNFSTVIVTLFFVLLAAWLLSLISLSDKEKPVVLFLLSFVAAASFWTEPEVIVDAARYFTQAKHLKVFGAGYFAEQWGKSIFAWTDLPLVPFLYGLVFKFFGEYRVPVQILNTIFYSLTVILTYQLGRGLWDEETGFNGGILLLGFPYLYTQVPLFLVDVPTMFFLMLAVVTCFYALQSGGAARIVAAGFSLFLAFYAKYSSWMLLAVIPVMFAYFLFRQPGQAIRRGGILALISFVLIGILFLLYRDIIMDQLDFLIMYQRPGMKRWSESYVSTFLFQVHPFVSAAAIISFVVAIRKRDLRFLIVCFLLLLFLFLQVKRIRYTLPIFPMIALLAAYGIEAIQNREIKKHILYSIAGSSFVVAFAGFLPLLKSLGVQNLQQAGMYLNTLAGENIQVYSFAGENAVVNPDLVVPVLDIYTDKKLYCDKRQISPETLERVRDSPLRFTWEYPLPSYYSKLQKTETADGLVIITDEPDRPVPEYLEPSIAWYPVQKTFRQSSKIFQHQTYVTVYHK